MQVLLLRLAPDTTKQGINGIYILMFLFITSRLIMMSRTYGKENHVFFVACITMLLPIVEKRTTPNNTKQNQNFPRCSRCHLHPYELFHTTSRTSPSCPFLLLFHRNFRAYLEMYCTLLDA